jgi:hypothetical protein
VNSKWVSVFEHAMRCLLNGCMVSARQLMELSATSKKRKKTSTQAGHSVGSVRTDD